VENKKEAHMFIINKISPIVILTIAFVITCCIFTFCFADNIALKNGSIIEGTIIESLDEYVIVEVDKVPVKFYRNDIKDILVKSNNQPLSEKEKSAIKNELALSYFAESKNLRKEGLYYKAILELEKAIEIDSVNSSLYYSAIARMHYNLRQYEQALEFCQRALELEPNNSAALACFSLTYYRLGKHDEARSYFHKFKESIEDNNDPIDMKLFKIVEDHVGFFEQVAQGQVKDIPYYMNQY
jgi:tetratricopeptide (TPR) repeat protein